MYALQASFENNDCTDSIGDGMRKAAPKQPFWLYVKREQKSTDGGCGGEGEKYDYGCQNRPEFSPTRFLAAGCQGDNYRHQEKPPSKMGKPENYIAHCFPFPRQDDGNNPSQGTIANPVISNISVAKCLATVNKIWFSCSHYNRCFFDHGRSME